MMGHHPTKIYLPALKQNLHAAILEQARRDLKHINSGHVQPHKQAINALQWLMQNEITHDFCFLRVCEVLGLEPTSVRVVEIEKNHIRMEVIQLCVQ